MEIPLVTPPLQFQDNLHVESDVSQECIGKFLNDCFGVESSSILLPNVVDNSINVPRTSTGVIIPLYQ